MRKRLRKLLLLLSICCLVGVWGVNLPKTYAVSPEEIREIPTNTVVDDCLETDEAVKYYKFTMDKTGYFQMSFQIPGFDVDPVWGWKVTLLDTDGNTSLYEAQIKQNTVFPAFPFAKGKVCYIKISAQHSDYAPTGVAYQICMNTFEDTSWEVEDNNDATKANKIVANTLYRGNLMLDDDVDYYAFETTEDGYFTLDFAIPGIDVDVNWGWYVTIFKDQKEIHNYTWKENSVTCPYNFEKGTKLLIKIEAAFSNYCPKYVEYDFTVKTTASKTWEQESNDEITLANNLPFGKNYQGTIYVSDDNDYYKLNMTKSGFITYTFHPNGMPEQMNWGYHLYLYNTDNKLLYEVNEVKGKDSATLYLNKGVYYFRIAAQSSNYEPDNYMIYNLKVTNKAAAKPAKVTIKSLKTSAYTSWGSKRYNFKYKIKGIANVKGYEYQYCTNKKFKKDMQTGTFEDVAGIFGENLVKKKKYYVRIRAYYETPDGEKAYGAWSSVKTIKIK